MEPIALSMDDVVPLAHIAPGVSGLRIVFVNVFGIAHASGWTLVDAGLTLSAPRIKHWAKEQFGGAPPKSIILTHGHFDHVGVLKELAEEWNVLVYAHAIELPYITGQQEYLPPDSTVGGGIMPWMSPLFPRSPIDLGARAATLPFDNSVPDLPVGAGFILLATHRDTCLSIASRTRCCFREMRSAPQTSNRFLRSQRKSLRCKGHRRTSRPTGMPRGAPWKLLLSCRAMCWLRHTV